MWWATLVTIVLLAGWEVKAAEIDCTTEASLVDVISCVKSAIQPKDSALYSAVTDEATHDVFYSFIQNVTKNRLCPTSLPAELSSFFKAKSYVEENSTYCIIYTYQDANTDGYFDDGYGVYVINMSEDPNPVSIVVPHPLYDTNTPALGIGVFSSLRGHVFSIAGAHRHANDVTSACQSSYKVADSVHNIDNLFYTFHRAIHNLTSAMEAGPLPHVQFHSMGSSTCPGVDVFISSGFSDPSHSSSPASAVYNSSLFHQSDWNISFPDAPNSFGCNLYGTGNTVGRMMNGVASTDVCSTSADKNTALASSVFVQIELKWDYRSATDWIPIMTSAFPFPVEDKDDCLSINVKYGYKS